MLGSTFPRDMGSGVVAVTHRAADGTEVTVPVQGGYFQEMRPARRPFATYLVGTNLVDGMVAVIAISDILRLSEWEGR